MFVTHAICMGYMDDLLVGIKPRYVPYILLTPLPQWDEEENGGEEGKVKKKKWIAIRAV